MRLNDILASVAGAPLLRVARQLEAKNRELNRLNQQLLVQEKTLAREVGEALQALETANEFNRRVIESLSAGVAVIDADSGKITLCSSRMEDILGVPAEDLLGHEVHEALAGVRGIDIDSIVDSVVSLGQLPATKLRLTLRDDRCRSVYVRAQRMYTTDGLPEGTVVVLEDVSEREFLIDSFSRYVSRDLVQRLLVRGAEVDRDWESRVCTVMMVRIPSFAARSGEWTHRELWALLRDYLRVVIDAVLAQQGIVDTLVGDRVLAVFPSAVTPSEGVQAALVAARRIGARARDRVSAARPGPQRCFDVGIGLATGPVVQTSLGTSERRSFTVMGDTVHLAEQLCSRAGAGEVLADRSTVRSKDSSLEASKLGEVELEGRSVPTEVYSLEVPTPECDGS